MNKLNVLIISCFLLLVSKNVVCQNQSWQPVFDGKTLNGWTAKSATGAFEVKDGQLITTGVKGFLFFSGKIENADFKNFECRMEVKTSAGGSSGIFFHTQSNTNGSPAKGYEVLIQNSAQSDFKTAAKTGSLAGIRNFYKPTIPNDEWCTLYISVKNKHIQVKINTMTVVDYVEPDNAPRNTTNAKQLLSNGTFAIRANGGNGKVCFRKIEVNVLPNTIDEKVETPVVDSVYKEIAMLHAAGFPLIDYHVHIKGSLTLESTLYESMRDGVTYGIAVNCGQGFPVHSDSSVTAYYNSMKNQPAFIAMQAEGREWVTIVSREAVAKFEYIFTDGMTWTNDKGRRMRLWLKDEVEVGDKQEFMEMLVNRIVGIFNYEPVDIYVNPTYLPEVIANEYDALWTEKRMKAVIDAAAKNNIAIEINNRFKIPSIKFIKLAKAAGCKFSFGTNNLDKEFGRLEYCLQAIKECGITAKDMFTPNPDGKKKVQTERFKNFGKKM